MSEFNKYIPRTTADHIVMRGTAFYKCSDIDPKLDEIAKLKEEIKRLESWVTAAGEFILGQTYLMNDDEKLIVKKFANKIIEAAK